MSRVLYFLFFALVFSLTSERLCAQQMYGFVDEAGDLVISDQPLDKRYRPYVFGKGFVDRMPSASKRGGGDKLLTPQIEGFLRASAKKHKVPYSLLKAVAAIESQFNPLAKSRAGASGVMQLMPATAKSLGVRQIFDARENIDAGARYLARLLVRFESTELALAAYNAGPTRVEREKRVPEIAETQNYVRNVLNLAHEYQ